MAGKYRQIFYYVNKYILRILPDNLFHNAMSFIMHYRFGVKFTWMRINSPETFSEKLQWLKKNGPTEIKTILADKYDVREFVRNKIGESHLVELIKLNNNNDVCVNSIDKVDWDILPNQFVLKTTKGSGFNLICNNKSALNKNRVFRIFKKWIKINNYYFSREPQYLGENRLIAEKLLQYNITDYKFFCFDGMPQIVELYIDRLGKHRKAFYDIEWNLLPFTTAGDTIDESATKPEKFEEMVEIAKKLSIGFPFVRIDLYENKGNIYFGEMTFHPAGGYTPITPIEWERKLGKMINVP